MTDSRPRAQFGDRCISFTMQPCGADGSPLHGGNHWANADTLEAARRYARDVLTMPRERGFCCMRAVESVDISGGEYEFTGGAWKPLHGRDRYRHHEVITRADITTSTEQTSTEQTATPDSPATEGPDQP